MMWAVNSAASIDEVKNIINSNTIPSNQKVILLEIANSSTMKNSSREALARRLVELEEERVDKTLNKTDVITRVGPTLGLMGTLIPMGPGLAALGAGDINTLASSLTIDSTPPLWVSVPVHYAMYLEKSESSGAIRLWRIWMHCLMRCLTIWSRYSFFGKVYTL